MSGFDKTPPSREGARIFSLDAFRRARVSPGDGTGAGDATRDSAHGTAWEGVVTHCFSGQDGGDMILSVLHDFGSSGDYLLPVETLVRSVFNRHAPQAGERVVFRLSDVAQDLDTPMAQRRGWLYPGSTVMPGMTIVSIRRAPG